jgi:hypothetical protein
MATKLVRFSEAGDIYHNLVLERGDLVSDLTIGCSSGTCFQKSHGVAHRERSD